LLDYLRKIFVLLKELKETALLCNGETTTELKDKCVDDAIHTFAMEAFEIRILETQFFYGIHDNAADTQNCFSVAQRRATNATIDAFARIVNCIDVNSGDGDTTTVPPAI
jgi:hypothetical protein